MTGRGTLWRALASFVAVWGTWKEAVSLLACAFALPMTEHLAIEVVFVVRGSLWAVAAYGLLARRAWARPLWLGLWFFTSVVMSAWWFATDPMSSSALFAVVSTVAAIGLWRTRLEAP